MSKTETTRMHILAALAEMERGLIIERTMAGLAAGKARGRVGGRKPSLTHEKEAEAIAMLLAGARPADVAKALGVSKSTIYNRIAKEWASALAEGTAE